MQVGKASSIITRAPSVNRRSSFPWVAGLALMWGLSAAAVACDPPATKVDVPDGRSATEEQMGMAQQAVQAYVAEAETYIACLEGSGMAAVQVRRLRDQTIDEMERHAAQFNRQLRHYRNR